MLTGRELYELLQARAYGFLWAGWDLLAPEVHKPFDEVAGILNERADNLARRRLSGDDT